jgi:preprotein translocase subunit YajC
MIGGLFVVIVVWMIFSKRSQKKKQEEVQNTLDAVRPGNKVKTIGGICGIVVEVCPEDNTFILETGSESTGKCYMKFDKQAIYQTDAVAKKEEKPAEKTVEAPVEETEAPVENNDAE